MTQLRHAIASLLALLVLCPVLAAESLTPFEIRFKAETEYLSVGTATLALTRFNDSVFKLQLETEPAGYLKFSGKGIVIETAHLASAATPFAAFRYEYFLHGSKKKSYTAQIDHERRIVRINQQSNTRELNYDGDIRDRLSITLEMIDLLSRQPNAETIEFNVLDGGKLRTMSYVNEGRHQIDTPLGTFSAIRLKRQRTGSNRVTTTWFAELEHNGKSQLMPIRIEQHKKGKLSLRLTATKLSMLE
jgi:hypothetical protein